MHSVRMCDVPHTFEMLLELCIHFINSILENKCVFDFCLEKHKCCLIYAAEHLNQINQDVRFSKLNSIKTNKNM